MNEPVLVPLHDVVATALAEDLGPDPSVAADVTAAATVGAADTATARFVPRQPGVVAGLAAVAETWRQLDPAVSVRLDAADGDRVEPGQVIASVIGPSRSIMAGERTALNLLTHLSGIATTTRQLVDAIGGHACLIRDTRKTLPGLRLLQKQAVIAGGGANHRMALTDELLVKDNHVAAAGSIEAAAHAALAGAGGLPVQIEVDSLAQLDAVLAAGGRRVMVDNFSLEDTREAVRRCRRLTAETGEDVFLEASGGVTLDTVAAIAATGVDAIAVGALTHSSGALDIGLDIRMDTSAEGGGVVLLAVDVGNSTTVIGVYEGNDLLEHWRIATDPQRTADEFALLFQGFMAFQNLSFSRNVHGVVLSSVVPLMTERLVEMTEKYFHFPPVVVRPGTKTGFAINMDNPREVGADRLVNAIAAHHRYGGPGIVVDFGTSTNFDVYTEDGTFIGGVIAPGVMLSMEALASRGAQLPKFELRRPRSAIGRNTVEAMQSGAVYGFAGQVDRIVQELIAAHPEPDPVVIATGGLASAIVDECHHIDHHEPWLTLAGLRLIWERNTA